MSAGRLQLVVELPEADVRDLVELVDELNAARAAVSSHGELTVAKLAAMLLEDAALARRRPGSWEGANMLDLLAAHGYAL